MYYRERAFKGIDAFYEYPLIWIDGQAGAGKSSLLSSYLEFNGFDNIWYNISEADNNLLDFIYKFSSSLKSYLSDTSHSLEMLALPFQPDIQDLFTSILNEIDSSITSPFYIVFDDVHLLHNEEFHSTLIDALVQLNLQYLKVIIISRCKPNGTYSRLRARRKISQLNNDYLRWNDDEISCLVALITNTSGDELNLVNFQAVNGWVSGVILLLETYKGNHRSVGLNLDFQHEYSFDYFANEIFSTLDESTQTLLIKASFLKEIDVIRDRSLMGNVKLKHIIVDLYNRNYFISINENIRNIYTLHPLFKEFLQQKSAEYFDSCELQAFKNELADSLFERQDYESAIALFIEVKNWQCAADTIVAEAERMLSHGKWQLIQQWIEAFDRQYYESDAWLQYWNGMSLLSHDQKKAFSLFSCAFEKFQKVNDINGIYCSVCGVLESIVFSFNRYDRLKKWTDFVTEKYQSGEKPRSIKIQARLSANMHTALLFSDPSHADLVKWEKNVTYLMKLLTLTFSSDHRVLVGVNLFYQYLFNGERKKAERILNSTKVDASGNSKNPVSRGAWYVMFSLYSWINGNVSDALQACDVGLASANKSGIRYWKSLLLMQKAYAYLTDANLELALNTLKEVEQDKDTHSHLILSMYYDALAYCDYLQGQLDSALENISFSIESAKKLDMKYALLGYELGLAEIHIARKEYSQARDTLQAIRCACEKTNGFMYLHRCSLLETRLALETGNRRQAKFHLNAALTLAKERNFVSHSWRIAENEARIYSFALEENICTDFVVECIKTQKLTLSLNLIEYINWCWPVKIHTFGDFKIFADNRPLPLTGKSQRKPLTLLKAIISFGPWRVNQNTLAEKLWPDADGDEALRTLHTTIHRLRRLIGTKALLVKDGLVGLNPELVWIDSELAEFYFYELNRCIHNASSWEKGLEVSDKLFSLYIGKFLENQQDDVWSLQKSEELHKNIIGKFKRFSHHLANQGMYEQALSVLNRIEQLDILDESIYRERIVLLIKLNRNTEAIGVYQECRNLMSKILGLMPSPALTALIDDSNISENFQKI